MAVRRMVFAAALAGLAMANPIKPIKPTGTFCGIICISAISDCGVPYGGCYDPCVDPAPTPLPCDVEGPVPESPVVVSPVPATTTSENPSSVTPASDTPEDEETPEDSEDPEDEETPDSESPIAEDPVPAGPTAEGAEVTDLADVQMEIGSTPENPLPWIPDENEDSWWW
ncbi:hypothetical protein THAR02_03058 [Trichoderma harzianum]|uniref:Uncharacterized protein n=1 Tax=Trichoderma harzianum TaxID=5544 RepID=A0A0F9XK49_TRIHA|nr:hypothetical protein THAR02_03058 [Trichoderma harzianum]